MSFKLLVIVERDSGLFVCALLITADLCDLI